MIRPLATFCLCSILLLSSAGCAALGYIASAMPSASVKARYAGLQNQRVAIMTWVDRGPSFEYPTLRGEISQGVMNKLKMAAPAAEDLKGALIIDARAVLKWQKNHPEYEGRALSDVAPLLGAATGATRVIYIELTQFTTRDARSDALLKGFAVANLRVAEVSGSFADVKYDEVGVESTYPEKSPEGVPISESVNLEYVYNGLVNDLTKQVAIRFFASSPDEK